MIVFFHSILGLVALGWAYALFKTVRGYRRKPFQLSKNDAPARTDIPVSIVIPARNEEANIHRSLRSALEQDHGRIQVVVLNDGSTDRTAEEIDKFTDDRLKVLHGDGSPLPDGWFGKPWALQRAQKSANGDWLAFIDADVELESEAISRALGYALKNDLDMVTGLGRLEMKSFWEKVMQPAVGGLILAGNSLREVNDPSKKDKNLANGQFILISRHAYDRLEGHKCVQRDILDDIGIARAVSKAGMTYHCLDLQYLFQCRMYTSLGEIWEGWSKNLFAGLRYSWANVFVAILFTLLFSVSGQLLLLLGSLKVVAFPWLLWGMVLTTLCQGVRLIMDIRRQQNIVYGLTHAPASLLVCFLIVNSGLRSLRGTVKWKGRTYKPTG